MPFYRLSLGEEEEVEELALKLTPGDSESWQCCVSLGGECGSVC